MRHYFFSACFSMLAKAFQALSHTYVCIVHSPGLRCVAGFLPHSDEAAAHSITLLLIKSGGRSRERSKLGKKIPVRTYSTAHTNESTKDPLTMV